MHLHIRINPPKCIRPVLVPSRQLITREISLHKGINSPRLRVISDKATPDGIGCVLLWRTPCAVEEVLVCAFAEQEADSALAEFVCEGAICEGLEERGADEGVVCRWAEFVKV